MTRQALLSVVLRVGDSSESNAYASRSVFELLLVAAEELLAERCTEPFVARRLATVAGSSRGLARTCQRARLGPNEIAVTLAVAPGSRPTLAVAVAAGEGDRPLGVQGKDQ